MDRFGPSPGWRGASLAAGSAPVERGDWLGRHLGWPPPRQELWERRGRQKISGRCVFSLVIWLCLAPNAVGR